MTSETRKIVECIVEIAFLMFLVLVAFYCFNRRTTATEVAPVRSEPADIIFTVLGPSQLFTSDTLGLTIDDCETRGMATEIFVGVQQDGTFTHSVECVQKPDRQQVDLSHGQPMTEKLLNVSLLNLRLL